ncbi:HAMP domain-containing histidine kinase [Flagellimonas sp. HMM57]|uniref:sensor histidine kinase n=1 Tax=unclassified Flagellimonas TaxID=2644544 RepID=UPI0013D22DCC|nr:MULTISPECIES: HAMP domain-containing sensor histidine kinase [unclassified Flagellimonas]UII76874.1 HAMP domain-containing histidine kinase [Flagellimonas sp. HMM57]
MKQGRYTLLLYFISSTIFVTIAIQLYWNIQNYKGNKRRLTNEVQISLDNSVEIYFSDLAKTDIIAFANNRRDSLSTKKILHHMASDSAFKKFRRNTFHVPDSGKVWTQIMNPVNSRLKPQQIKAMSVFNKLKEVDSTIGLANLTSKIIFAITKDTLDFQKLDTLLQEELSRKGIDIKYSLQHIDRDSIIRSFKEKDSEKLTLTTISKSTYLPRREQLKLSYSNPTITILKYSLTGMLLSFLLSICIIGCLFYLLHIIKRQKELAEIKNDLINNITHEFKTPIATASTAIEAIKNFNQTNDKVKTETYLDISDQQLKKLNLMVEKLLETATLDNDKLLINKESIDLVLMTKRIVNKYQMVSPEKRIHFTSNKSEAIVAVDVFHFENVLANLVDNAIKYGGSKIEININVIFDKVEIKVADNGGKIDDNQKEKIFDKFYRIPTGNQHDIKGFGIGLFYTKKIVEKHGGQLVLLNDKNHTIFKILLWNDA